ncbi:hypothetical protein ACVTNF_001472 [Photobacterium damselae]
MMNHIKILPYCISRLIVFFFVIISANSYGENLYVEISGNKIKHGNVVLENNKLRPLTWFPKQNLLPVISWSPIFNPEKKIVTFSNGKNSFRQKIELHSISFKTSGFRKASNPMLSSSVCPIDENNETIYTVGDYDTGDCISSSMLVSDSEEIDPFRYMLPVIKLDGFLDNINGLPAGRYNGSYPINIKYLFKRKNGVISYRNVPFIISFEILYNPAEIFDVIPHGLGVIEPIYDNVKRTVSGQTTFDIDVKGIFPSGVRLRFEPTSISNKFELIDNINGNKFPYYVNCDKCDKNQIVDSNGNLIVPNGVYDISTERTDFNFNLDVGFKDINASDIDSGGYYDSFYVYFEPIM